MKFLNGLVFIAVGFCAHSVYSAQVPEGSAGRSMQTLHNERVRVVVPRDGGNSVVTIQNQAQASATASPRSKFLSWNFVRYLTPDLCTSAIACVGIVAVFVNTHDLTEAQKCVGLGLVVGAELGHLFFAAVRYQGRP